MKKLLFFLLTLVGTGMFYSCQQDEFVNESTVSKGATITATLPTDAQSRLALGDPENRTVKLKWEIGDIVVGESTWRFEVVSVSEDGSKATLYCEDAPEYLPSNSLAYEFVYGDVVDYDEQSGTLDGLYMMATVGADENVAWEDVNLEFEVYSAIVEIELPDDVSATKVSLYDSSNGALIASTVEDSYSDKVYLAVSAYRKVNIGGGLVLVETSNGDHVAQVGQNSLESGKVYSIKQGKMVALQNTGTTGTTELVKYGSVGNTYIFYGSGAIVMELFYENTNIHHAIILEGVTEVVAAAFNGCTNLASVVIPNSVTVIDSRAFSRCESLTSVTIPESVVEINDMAFEGCSQLSSVRFLSSMPCSHIARDTFDGCNDNLTIFVPEGSEQSYIDEWHPDCYNYICIKEGNVGENITYAIRKDGTAIFSGQGELGIVRATSNFTKAVLNNGITSIGNSAFVSNTSLASVRVPASVNSIGQAAFQNCTSLKTITIEQGSQLTTINGSAFFGCTALESITIPASVTSIGQSAFYGCTAIASITIPASVNSIGPNAFQNCTSLETVIIEQGSQSITINDAAFYGCTAIESITIPASVNSIGHVAFYDCTSLKTVTCLAVEPPTLGDNVFYNCLESLTIYVPSGKVDTYKGTSGWSSYAGKIQAIS